MHDIQLHRNAFDRLILTDTEGVIHSDVVPVHAFPISAPAEGIALVNAEGHELAWFDNLSEIPAHLQDLISEEFASREFIPEIHKISTVSTFATPSIWVVDTDRGKTDFVLKGEDDIRRLNHDTLLITDSHGIHFLIRDMKLLDNESRKLLDRFL